MSSPCLSHRRVRALGLVIVAAIGVGCAALPGGGSAARGGPATEPTPAGAAPSATAASPGATTPRPGTTGASPSPARPPTAASSPARPAFADVIKGARQIEGLFTLWQKDDKVWIEIGPAQFEQSYLLVAARTSGLGERGLYANWPLGRQVVSWRKINGTAQLLARNTQFGAQGDPGLARAARISFSDSLIGSAPIASAEHPQRKSVLVELSPIFLTDLPQLSRDMEVRYRLGYGFDARNSYFKPVRADAGQAVLEVTAHYSVPRLPVAPPGAPPGAVPSTPRNLADARSFFIDYQYVLTQMPDPPMRARPADPRIGHFVQQNTDFGTGIERDPRRFIVNRWRLEKKDPQAPMSEPVKPIVFWLDRNIPARYREAIRAGVLEWNKAFERIGFRDAIRAPDEPQDAPMDLAGPRHASVRWFLDSDEGALAIGPSVVDPRTGEIVDADVAMSDNWARVPRRIAREQLPGLSSPSGFAAPLLGTHEHDAACQHARDAMAELDFSLALMQARGELDPESPQAEALVLQVLKDVTMHEIGHTLGLRHNFRASLAVPVSRLTDAAFTREQGLSGSVMDYNAFNIPLQGEPLAEFAMTTLGAYDYWAIEYAYRPFAPQDEAAGLAAIAARSHEPALAYGTDEEALAGYDPHVNMRDLGDDPLAWADRRFRLTRELWQRLQTRAQTPGASFGRLRQNFESGLRQLDLAADTVAKFVGGVHYYRDLAGGTRPSFVPVGSARQREALRLLAREVFSAQSLVIDPSLAVRLSEDALERGYAPPSLPGLPQRVLVTQRRLLERLLGDPVLARLQELETTMAPTQDRLRMPELFDTLRHAIWQELDAETDIVLTRRLLQREHVRKLTGLLLRSASTVPADARSLARADAIALAERIGAARRLPRLSREARAHLDESLASLQDALKASLNRSAT